MDSGKLQRAIPLYRYFASYLGAGRARRRALEQDPEFPRDRLLLVGADRYAILESDAAQFQEVLRLRAAATPKIQRKPPLTREQAQKGQAKGVATRRARRDARRAEADQTSVASLAGNGDGKKTTLKTRPRKPGNGTSGSKAKLTSESST